MPFHKNRCRTIGLLAFAAFSIAGLTGAMAQAPREKPQPGATPGVASVQAPVPPPDSELYCKNIAEAASDARIKWQTWKLISLEAKLRGRIEELQRREREFEIWVKRREDLLNEVEDQVVSIIGRMRPETAAAQLSTTDEEAAVGVLLKLKSRVASSILDEMEPSRAAQLTQSMMGLTHPETQRSF
ncbi:MotE family protein [Roseibium sp. M-1]